MPMKPESNSGDQHTGTHSISDENTARYTLREDTDSYMLIER